MSIGIGKEMRIKQASQYVPYSRLGTAITRRPGRMVNVIAVRAKNHPKGGFNPLVMFFTVNRYRKDYREVLEQTERTPQLPAYEQSLLDSCFKNW